MESERYVTEVTVYERLKEGKRHTTWGERVRGFGKGGLGMYTNPKRGRTGFR